MSKRCTACNITKPLAAFNLKRRGKHGRHAWCKACVSEYNRRYRKEHHNRLRVQKQLYTNSVEQQAKRERAWQENKEELSARGRRDYAKHREARLEKARLDRKENPEKFHARDRQDRETHRAERVMQHRRWHKENSQHVREYDKQYRIDHPETIKAANRRRRALRQGVQERFIADMAQFTRAFWDHTCALCGETEDLCIDHWRPLSAGNPLTLANAVVLCQACNTRKRARDPDDIFAVEVVARIETKLLQQCLTYDCPDVGGDLLELAVA